MRIAILVAALSMLVPCSAQAQATWNPQWGGFNTADAFVTVGFAGLALTTELIGPPREPRWGRPVFLDGPVRRAIGSSTSSGEHRAARVSDVLVVTLIAGPILDATVVGTSVHRDGVLARNFALLSFESLAVTFGVTNLTKVLVGRDRPEVAECAARRIVDPTAACDRRPPVSFFSGHSAAAFTGAGLICAFGTVTSFHGEGAIGQIPCVTGLALAGATAVLRIVANKHHTTDVLLGSAVGLLSGWAWPALRLRAD